MRAHWVVWLCWSIAASQMCWFDTLQTYSGDRRDAAPCYAVLVCSTGVLPTACHLTLACRSTYILSPLSSLQTKVRSPAASLLSNVNHCAAVGNCCAAVSRHVRGRAAAQLRGNIGHSPERKEDGCFLCNSWTVLNALLISALSCWKIKLPLVTCFIASNICWDSKILQQYCRLIFTPSLVKNNSHF